MKTCSIDILLMVMKSAIHAWHLGQHVNLNTTRDFPVHLVFPLLTLIARSVVQLSTGTLFSVLFCQQCLIQHSSFTKWEAIFGDNC